MIHDGQVFRESLFSGIVEGNASVDFEYVDCLFHKYMLEITKLALRLLSYFEAALGLEKGRLFSKMGK